MSYTRGYLALLARYGVDYDVQLSDAPGRILYEDEVQVVAIAPSREPETRGRYSAAAS